MEYLFIFLAVIFAVTGLLGAVLPVLPGPPIAFLALLMLLLCDGNDISTTALVVTGVLALVITIVDYIAPVWFAKKTGGSKYGTWGATIGLVAGLFLGPLGVIVGPFIGAFIGERIADTPSEKAFGVAFMTFAAFMLTTGIKLVYGVVLLVMVCKESWEIIFK
ncbi:MAG: DUF456 domain-containing protein [Bacteroidaceae bacterium]|jgi:uncharacterized protein YqgC (DUF456 family)|nr:DUF456 domain-containing protein [Bacteroidaceae bacterium]MBQ2290332.1 DUF456 domain-containing protein [Bacteroidaceae bacterium]MBQ5616926.1 DUF456 domain-containing protein [Bacteroidaceae bacterium]